MSRRYINQAGINIIKEHEGCELDAYRDSVGILTIGWGHTGADVHEGMIISQMAADDILASDLNRFEDGVESLVIEDINDNQFSALVSFSFNVGLNNLRVSTLLKKLNAGDISGAADEFLQWTKAGGKVLPGLVSRRKDERQLFLS